MEKNQPNLKDFVEREFNEFVEGEYDDQGFLIPQMVLFRILMEFILIEKDLISLEDIMTTIMNINQEKDGMKPRIVILMR